MPDPNSRSGPGRGGRSETEPGQVGHHKGSSTLPRHPAADAWRANAPAHLSATLGVRPDGPLDWTPPDLPAPYEGYATEGPLAVARRRTLTRRHIDELEHGWRVSLWWQREAAA
jgi:hypothetical protein